MSQDHRPETGSTPDNSQAHALPGLTPFEPTSPEQPGQPLTGSAAQVAAAKAYAEGKAAAEAEAAARAEYDPMAGLPVVPAHVTKEIFHSALKSMLLLVVVVLIVGSGLGYLFAGIPGVWSALLAVGVTLIFSGTTIWSMLFTADKAPNTTMAVVLGAWVAKMGILLVILAVLNTQDFYHKTTFGIIVLVAVFGSALLDMRAVIKGRMPYVTPVER